MRLVGADAFVVKRQNACPPSLGFPKLIGGHYFRNRERKLITIPEEMNLENFRKGDYDNEHKKIFISEFKQTWNG